MKARLDPRPLLAYAAIGVTWRNGEHDTRAESRGRPTDDVLATRLGVTRETIARWRHGTHTLSGVQADRLCARLGVHPLEVWDIAAYNDLVPEPRERKEKE